MGRIFFSNLSIFETPECFIPIFGSLGLLFLQTMKPSDPLLLADDTLHCGMYPAGKVAISTPSHPQVPPCDHTVGKLNANAGSLCSEV